MGLAPSNSLSASLFYGGLLISSLLAWSTPFIFKSHPPPPLTALCGLLPLFKLISSPCVRLRHKFAALAPSSILAGMWKSPRLPPSSPNRNVCEYCGFLSNLPTWYASRITLGVCCIGCDRTIERTERLHSLDKLAVLYWEHRQN